MADYQRRQHLKEFHKHAQELLTDGDRDYLYHVLKEYQTYKQVDKLVQCLKSALDSPQKMDLLKEIRNLIPSSHVGQFDKLAPYHKMAHPFTVPNQVRNKSHPSSSSHHQTNSSHHTDTNSKQRRHRSATVLNGHSHSHQYQHHNQNRPRHQAHPNNDKTTFQVITINKTDEDSLGFSIRGGSEHGLGIYISEVDSDSVAEKAGLDVGDNIVEVNNVSFENLASSSAVKVLTGSNRLKMVIRRTGKIPGFKYAKEKTSWFDTHLNKITNEQFEENGGRFICNEKRVNLTVTKREQFLGFNIRGGSEYGLGIYVSRIDHGGLAQQKGITEGDQILQVNGKSFENVTHANAVDFLKSQTQLVVTVRELGRYPAYKELYAEYSWQGDDSNRVRRSQLSTIKSEDRTAPKEDNTTHDESVNPENIESTNSSPVIDSTGNTLQVFIAESQADDTYLMPNLHSSANIGSSGPHTAPPPRTNNDISYVSEGTVTQFPMESKVEVFTQTGRDETDSFSMAIQTEEVLPEQHELILPHTSDIILTSRTGSRTSTVESRQTPKSLKAVLGLKKNQKVERVQSLRGPGERDPRKVERDRSKERQQQKQPQKAKRSKTFREMLFGTKEKKYPKVKGAGSLGASSNKSKARANINIEYKKKEDMKSSVEESSTVSSKSQPVFSRGMGTQMMLHASMQSKTLNMVQDMVRKLLKEDETCAVSRHIDRYLENGDIELLVNPLLAILDKPEKMLLLREVRGIIRPTDLGRFDSMVSRQELEAYAEMAARMSTQSPQIMRRSIKEYGAPKKTLMATVPNSHGAFRLKTKEDYEKDVERKQELEKLKKEKLTKLRREQLPSEDYIPFPDLQSPDEVPSTSFAYPVVFDVHHRSNKYRPLEEIEMDLSGSYPDLPATRNIVYRSKTNGFMTSPPTSPQNNVLTPIKMSPPNSGRATSTPRSGPDDENLSDVNAAAKSDNENSLNSSAKSNSGNTPRSSFYKEVEIISPGQMSDEQTELKELLSAIELTVEENTETEPRVPIAIGTETIIAVGTETKVTVQSETESKKPVVLETQIKSIALSQESLPPVETVVEDEIIPQHSKRELKISPDTPLWSKPIQVAPIRPKTSPEQNQEKDDSFDSEPHSIAERIKRLSISTDEMIVVGKKSPELNFRLSTLSNSPTSPTSPMNVSSPTPLSASRQNSSGLYAIIKSQKADVSPSTTQITKEEVHVVPSNHEEQMTAPAADPDWVSSLKRDKGVLKSDSTNSTRKSLNWTENTKHPSSKTPSPQPPMVLISSNDTHAEAAPPPEFANPERVIIETKDECLNTSLTYEDLSRESSLSSADFRPLSTASFRSIDHPSDLSGYYDFASPHGSGSPNPDTLSNRSVSPQSLSDSVIPSDETQNAQPTGFNSLPKPPSPANIPDAFQADSDSDSDFEYPPPPLPKTSPPPVAPKRSPSPKFTPPPPPSEPPPFEDESTETHGDQIDTFTLVLKKNRTSLGISISGGRDSKSQPKVKVEKVFPGGAASDDGTLKGGMEIVKVDDDSLENASHPQAVDIIRRAYNNKTRDTMVLILRK